MSFIIVGVAGFLGGLLNSIAGGGSFITLPALIFVGVPPVAANATGTAALLPGYIASAWRFRHDLEFPSQLNFKLIILLSLVGGSIGAITLLQTNDQVFSSLIPWLILFAAAAFYFSPKLIATKTTCQKMRGITAALILFAVCIYGGYFNGGLGIILLASLSLMGHSNLHGMNGLKNIISALLTCIAVFIYGIGDELVWEYFIWSGFMAIFGGYIGAAFAYKIPLHLLRQFIVLTGIIMSIAFFLN